MIWDFAVKGIGHPWVCGTEQGETSWLLLSTLEKGNKNAAELNLKYREQYSRPSKGLVVKVEHCRLRNSDSRIILYLINSASSNARLIQSVLVTDTSLLCHRDVLAEPLCQCIDAGNSYPSLSSFVSSSWFGIKNMLCTVCHWIALHLHFSLNISPYLKFRSSLAAHQNRFALVQGLNLA